MDAVDMETSEDNHEDTIEETVPEVCRVCLLAHMIMRDLFVDNNVVSLSMKAMSFASVKMLPEDGLPAQVCCDCADKLEAAYEFKLQVEQADNVLRQRYDTLNIKEELFFNEVEVHLEAERDDDVDSLDVDAHYHATVDGLNAEDEDDEKPTLLKDHLALLEVEKLAKQQSALETEHKNEDVMNEDTEVSAMLQTNDANNHYLHEDDGNVVELGDCGEDYHETVKSQGIHVPDGITAEEHNYILQQGYTLTRDVEEELVTEEAVSSVDNETVNYLTLMDEEMSVKEDSNHGEFSNNVNTEENEGMKVIEHEEEEEEASPSKTRRSKRKLSKRRLTNDEDDYMENLDLSSRLKRTEHDKSEKFYFLCYMCDEQFSSKKILKEHMQSHEEVRRALSLKKMEKLEKPSASPTKASTITSTPRIAGTSASGTFISGKKANKCPYCGKEYLYVISFNKHMKKHEKKRASTSKNASFTLEKSPPAEAEDSSNFVAHDRSRESEANDRIETSNVDIEDNERETVSSSKIKRRKRSLRNEATSYSCESCDKVFSNKRELTKHSSEHLTTYKCNTCDRKFDELEKLRRHRSEHVVEGVLSQEDLEGNVYSRDFERTMQNNEGNEIFTGAELESQDDLCAQQNPANEEEEEDPGDGPDTECSWHLEVDENEDNDDTKDVRSDEMSDNWPETNNKCPNCSVICSSRKSLLRHMECHEVATRLFCKYCDIEFKTKDGLEKHIESEHNSKTKTFHCTDCNKIFGNELTLRNHLFATDHKTIIHGQQYDPNKRMKRVAARAAQKIIDKIKTEDMEDYEDQEDEEETKVKMENARESDDLNSDKTSSYSVQWSRQRDKIEEAESARKVQRHRNRRRHDYECESCERKCSSKQSLTKHMEQHRVKAEACIDTIDKLRKNNSLQMSDRSANACNAQQPNKPGTNPRRDETKDDDSENDENSDFGIGLDWPIDSHECSTCKKKYSTKKSLLRHQLLHEEPNFECDICNVKFYRKDKLKSHYDKCSEKNPDQVRKCNICGDTFENNEILKEHRSRHVDEGILTEEDLRDIEPGGMDDRRESAKVVRKRRTDIVGLECTECNKRYTSRKGLLRHIQVHEGKKYLCDICPKKFYRREHLKIHVAKHNMIKPYKCPRCTKRFIKEEQLSSHLSKHDRTFKKPKEADTSKRFLCEICSKSFTQSTTLIAHLRAHNGIKPYVCEVCARPFTTNAYLKMHMRTHTQERPYSCQYCSRAFARADTLANHLTSHTGEAKYNCKYCPKNFRRLKSLKEHVFIHTGQRPYACPTCDRRFNNNGSRYAHSKRCKQNHMQNTSREQQEIITTENLQTTVLQPIRLHQLTEAHELIAEHGEHDPHMQLVKPQSIKTITIARASDQLTDSQMLQHQEILMPLILPLTVTLTDVDEEVILPEGTKIYTTA